MRHAAITASALIAPSSPKVSWNARSGASACTPSRHCSTIPTMLMPTAPPSWRRKLIVLDPCEISSVGSPRIAPGFSQLYYGLLKSPRYGEAFFERLAALRPRVVQTPVLVAQFAHGSGWDNSTGDPTMALVVPFEQYLSSYVVATPATAAIVISTVAFAFTAPLCLAALAHF